MEDLKILGTMSSFFMQASQEGVPDSFKDTFNFLQGNGVYEPGVMHFLKGLKDTIWTHFDTFITDAQALAAIFMLIFFAIKSYEMMALDKKIEIMPLLRPFGLVLVIIYWGAFTRVIAFPTDIVAVKTEALFDAGQIEVNNLRLERAKLMYLVANDLTKIEAETETAKSEADIWYKEAWNTVTSGIKEKFSSVWNSVVELRNRMQINLQLWATYALETLAVWVLRICVYIIFMIQILYSTILIILGPFSVAVSILPAFRDSFGTWIARFISVNLYSGIAYLVMHVASLFQQYALEAEITRYQELLSSSGDKLQKLGWLAGNGIMSFGIVIVAFLIGGLSMLTVPSISTWIVSTSGITSAASTMGRGATNMARTARNVIAKF
ncbi:conserved membrane hypothetical protein [Sphingobacterium sp. PM2-P1-29]|nr:conserved membrane hypothetical protein [Sphingobacterium sp. PM2-P1-29]